MMRNYSPFFASPCRLQLSTICQSRNVSIFSICKEFIQMLDRNAPISIRFFSMALDIKEVKARSICKWKVDKCCKTLAPCCSCKVRLEAIEFYFLNWWYFLLILNALFLIGMCNQCSWPKIMKPCISWYQPPLFESFRSLFGSVWWMETEFFLLLNSLRHSKEVVTIWIQFLKKN